MRAILNVIRAVLGALIFAGVALNFANVVGRYVFFKPIIWAEEVLVFIMIWCVMLGATVVTWENQHLRMDAVYHLAATDAERARATVPQVANLFWGLARPVEAESILRRALDTVTDEPSQLVLTAMGAALDAFLARVSRAADSARTLLARPDLPGLAVMFAIWGLALGTGLQGRSDAVSTATGAWTDRAATALVARLPSAEHRVLEGESHAVDKHALAAALADWLGSPVR